MNEHEERGYNAFYEDKYPDDCPYTGGTPEYDLWQSGWSKAYFEDADIRTPTGGSGEIECFIAVMMGVFLVICLIGGLYDWLWS